MSMAKPEYGHAEIETALNRGRVRQFTLSDPELLGHCLYAPDFDMLLSSVATRAQMPSMFRTQMTVAMRRRTSLE